MVILSLLFTCLASLREHTVASQSYLLRMSPSELFDLIFHQKKRLSSSTRGCNWQPRIMGLTDRRVGAMCVHYSNSFLMLRCTLGMPNS
ncbi:hypothetical protein K503DRAFT_270706 [Rhizopogon vinicolor AM-OR11-026]|uniref:Secreted protein n=1 Tax=Rhizopogon vinicolor AM-OR11-026 TaxID=1314800 RepID=A0A1B7MW93_9AGAM|nr:hypothetical protein K503DRAFT_270706 [Rhizopogon vinicolor AM-OR11-026]